MNKTIYTIMIAAVTVFSLPLFADDAAKDAAISLPEVTTVISGDTPKAGTDALPDFSDVVPDTSVSPVLPVLPDISSAADAPAEIPVQTGDTDQSKRTYAEGLIGGGYPGFFTGLFSLYRSTGPDPFRLTFSHAGTDGYARHSYSEGYFDTATAVGGEKTVTLKSLALKFGGSYDSSGDGLQNQEPDIYEVTRRAADAHAGLVWTLPHGLSLKADAAGEWYNRFEGITGSTDDISSYIKYASIVSALPSLSFGWSGYGFTTGVSASYTFESDVGSTLADNMLHRGQFGVNFGYTGGIVRAYIDASAVIGTAIGLHPVIVPFRAGTEFSFATALSPRNMKVTTEGGLDSHASLYGDLEKAYKFSSLSVLPGETSDWYGTASVSVPVRGSLSFDADAAYRRTALGNGVWEPVYEGATAGGLYAFSARDRSQVSSDIGVSFQHGIFTLTGTWASEWMYVPVLEYPNSVIVKIAVLDADSRWGADTTYRQPLGTGVDSVPDVSLSAFYRVAPAVRLTVAADDVVKLVSGQKRTYAGRYIAKSGSAGLFAKFFF